MSLSSKVDLTEGRDFSDSLLHRLPPILSGGIVDISDDLDLIFSSTLITTEEYNVLTAWERIFGRRSLKNQVEELFRLDKEQRFNEETRTHCHRCGIEIRAPWKNRGCLCERCNFDLEQDYKTPWKRKEEGDRDTSMDIFDMR